MLSNIRMGLKLARPQRGASAVEYGLVVGLIAVALILVLQTLGGGLESLFQDAANAVTGTDAGDGGAGGAGGTGG